MADQDLYDTLGIENDATQQ
jgi:DnaJ-class molecular chaperone